MSVFAAVMTGKGTGAISGVQIFGDSAEIVIKKIFKPAGEKPPTFKPGAICLGTISDGVETIDQVTIGCEESNNFAINCHGNPLIVASLMQLLQRHGAQLLTVEELLAKIFFAEKSISTIALEAKLAQLGAVTIEGTKIITKQIDVGLNRTATKWLQSINTIRLKEITSSTAKILRDSRTAKQIIAGCTMVLSGPPNSGKSTLLNCLCGRQKAIVTDIKGTTRDWVSAQCRIGSLSVELIDTAGLDEELAAAAQNILAKKSQEKTAQVLEQADLVLLVLDNSQPIDQLDDHLLKKITHKKILTVLNKSDLPAKLDVSILPQILADAMQISAKFGTGIENLLKRIQKLCGVDKFSLQTAVCITDRQENLVKQLNKAKSKKQAVSIITELLNGRLSV
ncbi:MAG: GTPase [Planctomycetota bacterium]|jgi:tRNA modification GTPase